MTRAALLVRISDDRAGDALGVERQEQDCRALAARRGWDVVRVFRENDTSAYQRRKVRLPDGTTALRVVRPELRALLDAITAGEVTALVAYDLDRVARNPRDLEDLIDAVEAAGIPTAVVTGEVDLSTDNGAFMARMLVNVANKSSRDTSRRVRRAMLDAAEKGRVHGGSRPYGYEDDRVTPRPEEAALVRWALHEVVVRGRSLRSVGLEWQQRDPSRRWDVEQVKRTVTAPRVAGLRQHQGQIVGPAVWPALVERQEWEAARALLLGRPADRAVGGPRKYLLTGVLACSACSTDLRLVPLYPRRNADRQRFGCLPTASGGCGGMLVVYEPAEVYVVDLLLAKIGTLDLAAPDAEDPAAALRDRVAALERRQLALVEAFAQDEEADPAVLREATRALRERADAARREAAAVGRSQPRVAPQDVVRRWRSGDYSLAQRRAVLDAYVERVVVGPHPGGPRFVPSRLAVRWR